MKPVSSPELSSRYNVLPVADTHFVTDFWSNVYETPPDSTKSVSSEFPSRIATCMTALGYKNASKDTFEQVTFSSGLIGVERPMQVYRTKRAGAMLYFKDLQGMYYVSLRVVYFQPLSILKIARFGLLVTVFTFLYEYIRSLRVSRGVYFGESQYVIEQASIDFSDWFGVSIGITLWLLIVCGMWSWWWTGRFWNFLREDFDELYRDDLASIGHAAYNAIMDAADALSLKALTPQEQPVPTFGLGQVANPTRRQRRI